MADFHAESNPPTLDEALTCRLHELISRLYDEAITTEELAELNQFLHEYSEARSLYLRQVSLHSMLLARQGKQQCVESEGIDSYLAGAADRDQDASRDVRCAVGAQETEARNSRSQTRTWVIWSLAASLLIAAAGVFWTLRTSNEQPEVVVAPPPAARPLTRGRDALRSPATRLSYVSPNARWHRPNDAYSTNAAVPNGSVLSLADGQLEMTYHSGTKLLLVGPAEFVLQEFGGELLRGGLVASVTDAGHGFTICTPHGRVVDLGTEFGVAVDDFGISEVSVFQGKVEAFPQADAEQLRKIELTKGRGLQWDRDNVLALDADLRRFAAAVLDPRSGFPSVEEQASLKSQFRDAALDPQEWKVQGRAQTSQEGLRLLGDNSSQQPPYLISARQFDPAQGAITVSCDLRFADVEAAETVSFSILTRSTDERGIALPPWHGTLSSCARCSFSTGADAVAGVLQTGVKLATDRELTGISWSGFLPPAPDTPYRVVLRDDGVTLTLTVSLRDHPSSSKTVTCRSLFRGNGNFVALEGTRFGTTLIEHVEIHQELPVAPLANYADFSLFLNQGAPQAASEKLLLASLMPKGAVPVLQEEFAGNALDKNRWRSLGDVSVRNGAVEIGSSNVDDHIDTWKARPYLLTRKSFDPRQGKVTITGRIAFANNFLSGYGATFAVMTRSDAAHGIGSGWESSVLNRGVRASFWPAAWNTERTLEIHERTTPDALALLATRDLQADPRARSYLFRAVDDGQSVAFTVIDPRHPDLRMTISSPATLIANQGLVAFESCWGSPITLDDVSIFQEARPEAAAASPAEQD